ncbi:TetR/AcrR family transcriptional regulator [Hungatella hathewayi]|uniref:TetR/AcrR family transcriptional regulator n=1 Tax=Hungatella hathewayi TaxID=154046 RepID=UPI003568480F
MPTERFYKLPEEKKKAIRDAAMEECIRVPFEKVSINKIIQKAGISRGSFYTYFEDKRDVVRYIFSDTADKLKEFWTTSVVGNGGDLWTASEELLDQAISFSQKGKTFQMLQSFVLYQDFDKLFTEVHGTNNMGEKKGNEILTALYEVTDKDDFQKEDFKSFGLLVSMIMACVMESIGWYNRHMESEENIKKIFREKLEILQHGICKQ